MFEYKVFIIPLVLNEDGETELTRLGNEGWDLQMLYQEDLGFVFLGKRVKIEDNES